jgi:hypothetical protein
MNLFDITRGGGRYSLRCVVARGVAERCDAGRSDAMRGAAAGQELPYRPGAAMASPILLKSQHIKEYNND